MTQGSNIGSSSGGNNANKIKAAKVKAEKNNNDKAQEKQAHNHNQANRAKFSATKDAPLASHSAAAAVQSRAANQIHKADKNTPTVKIAGKNHKLDASALSGDTLKGLQAFAEAYTTFRAIGAAAQDYNA